ncbi:MAG: hypothetical protein AVDCRST_MAG88-434, partial [uncultured Thermomicrobiales bacterium]
GVAGTRGAAGRVRGRGAGRLLSWSFVRRG